MRLIHTSDWHLGLSSGPASRVEEQRCFLDWLRETMAERETDVLIVAGDIFDTIYPSAEAQSLYFGFLAAAGRSGVRDIVVVGGNHDSPSRLDAPRALLGAMNIHVVGGLPTAEHRAERMIVPLRVRGSDTVAAVCVAMPYIHEYRLGIRTTDSDRGATRQAFQDAFSGLYRELVDQAMARHPGVPIIATGHLTLGGKATRADAPQEIHRVGTLEGLPVELLDARVAYNALGHIHRAYPVTDAAWYSGSPIPYSLREMETARRVLEVEVLEGVAANIRPLSVPLRRALLSIAGPVDAVITALSGLQWAEDFPPLVQIIVETVMAVPGLQRRILEALEAHPEDARPRLMEVRQHAVGGAQTDRMDGAEVPPSLDTLTPTDVFALLCDASAFEGSERAALMDAFASVSSASDAEIDGMVGPMSGGVR